SRSRSPLANAGIGNRELVARDDSLGTLHRRHPERSEGSAGGTTEEQIPRCARDDSLAMLFPDPRPPTPDARCPIPATGAPDSPAPTAPADFRSRSESCPPRGGTPSSPHP